MATATLAATQGQQEKKEDPLQPLLFLVGTWQGEGKGPYGPYEFEANGERRGRWLLLTSNAFVPGSKELIFTSTQVYGYDETGLVLDLFDTAGAFKFRGSRSAEGVRFEWKGGESWKRIYLQRLEDGKIRSRYDAFEPSMFKEPVVFEGLWFPGKRPETKP